LPIARRQILKATCIGSGVACARLAAPSVLRAQTQRHLSIGAAGEGGIFYPLGSGMAALLSSAIPDLEAVFEQTDGSKDNIRLLDAGKIQIALAFADDAWDASQGLLDEVPDKVAVRALLATYSSHLHIVALEGAGIETVGNLGGKRICAGPARGGSEGMALRVLDAFGLGSQQLNGYVTMDYAAGAAALRERRLDAFLYNSGVPAAMISDLAAAPGVRIKLIANGSAALKLALRYRFYFPAPIPKSTYMGIERDVSTVAQAVLLLAHARLEDSLAYEITKAIVERAPQLGASHPAAREITLQNAVRGSPVPFHSGARRYYSGMGVTRYFLARCDSRDALSMVLAPEPELPRCQS
jgi:uncharacterized protein